VLLLVFVVEWRREFHARTDPGERLLTVGVTAALVFGGWQTFTVLVYTIQRGLRSGALSAAWAEQWPPCSYRC
jgi:hypothetical protein